MFISSAWKHEMETQVEERLNKQRTRKRTAVQPTERPDKVVLRPGGQHGQVQVDHLSIEWHVGDEVIVNVSFHRENFTHGQKNQEAEEGGGHFPDDLHLRKHRDIYSSVAYLSSPQTLFLRLAPESITNRPVGLTESLVTEWTSCQRHIDLLWFHNKRKSFKTA